MTDGMNRGMGAGMVPQRKVWRSMPGRTLPRSVGGKVNPIFGAEVGF